MYSLGYDQRDQREHDGVAAIGSTQATVSGQPQTLDVAPFIVGASTYVPLRFMAQSLGANVGYDATTRVVAIHKVVPDPPRVPRVRRSADASAESAPPLGNVRLRAQKPAPGSEIARPVRGHRGRVHAQVDPNSVRVWLDDDNRTMQKRRVVDGVLVSNLRRRSVSEPYGARRRAGTGWGRLRSFLVVRGAASGAAGASPHHLSAGPNAAVKRNFTLSGNTVGYGRVRVTAGASPSSTGRI